jgi:DNA mismatch repair protein MutS2
VSHTGITREQLSAARQQVSEYAEKVKPVTTPRRPAKKANVEETVAEGPLQIGDTVRVLSFGQNAELLGLSPDRSEAEVQMGSMRFRVSVDNIERLSKRQASTQERTQSQSSVVLPRYEDLPEVTTQLDIRGSHVEQALDELDNYLNDAVMTGMSTVRIVHGKGTGALRSAVREHLSHHPLVKSFTSPPPQEGGDGVTIIQLGG